MKRATTIALVTVIAALAVVLHRVSGGSPQRATGPISLKEVFQYGTTGDPELSYFAMDGNGDQIHYLQGPKLKIIDRRKRRVVATADYSDLPCPPGASAYDRVFSAWIILPSQSGLADRDQILALYCNTLVVLNARTLQVNRRLFTATAEEIVLGTAVSSDNRVAWAMLGRPVPNAPDEVKRAVFFDTTTWEKVQEWPMNRWVTQLNHDGTLAVISKHVAYGTPDGTDTCGIQVREVHSGKIAYEWLVEYRANGSQCPGNAELVPGAENLVVARVDWTFVLWDLAKAARVREFTSDNYLTQFMISPDGRLLLSTFHNDAEEGDYRQDFIIWEISSGRVLFESPRRRWTVFERLAGIWIDYDVGVSGFSDDARYLLVERHKSIHVYEIVPATAKE